MERHPEPPFEAGQPWHQRVTNDTTVVAVFDSLAKAHRALETLERHGIDAGEISVLGGAQEEGTDRRPVHAGSMATLFRRLMIGAVLGILAGAVVGAIAGPLLDVSAGNASIWGAAAGAVAGSLIGAMTGISLSDAWEETFTGDANGDIAVAVGSEDPRARERAHQVFEGCEAIRIIDLDRDGVDELRHGAPLERVNGKERGARG